VAAGGTVSKFTPTGVHTAFASGLTTPFALAFDSGGNLFVADGGDPWTTPPVAGAVYKFTPTGLRSTIVSDMGGGLAIDSTDNLFVGEFHWEQRTLVGSILKITPTGVRTTFASRIVGAMAFQPVQTATSTLVNISARASVQTGASVTIAGFIVTGTASKSVVVRGLGPTLGQPPFNVPNVLADPTLDLHDSASSIATNDDWQSASNSNQIPVNLRPPDSRESAILITLQPGNYTAILSGKNGTTGVGLVEVYDINSGAFAELTNVSTRGFVGTGDNVMIGGIITSGGNGSTQIVIRGLGPTLGQPPFNVPNVLADPALTLVDGNGNVVQTNNNWKTQQAAIQATGLAPPNDLEAAILATVAPGNYTAILSGNGGGMGIALVEVYKLR
jgi:hypothetical protein